MRKPCVFLGFLVLLDTAACQSGGMAMAPVAPVLPLRSLRLYETGVGYFERSGAVDPGSTSLPVPAGHLDDALKSLVVLSPAGGDKGSRTTLSGLTFGSSVSRAMGRALAGLPAEGDAPIGFYDLLKSLKGAAVAVRLGRGELQGRLVDVLAPTPPPTPAGKGDDEGQAAQGDRKADSQAELTLLLLTDQGAIRRVRSADVVSVRPLDPAFATRLGSALDALSGRGAQAMRSLRLLKGGGAVTIGYVSETPIWRTTYRLVLSAASAAGGPGEPGGVLQGWALIHNDADEDWHGVQVHLVNGRPDSFLFPLAAPRYGRRELVHPDNELSTVPQLLGETADALWGDHGGEGGGISLSGIGTTGGGSGYGSGMGHLGATAHGAGSVVGSSSLLEVGNLADIHQASGVEGGALFTYSLAEPLDLPAHGSALLPFLQQTIDVAPITWFSEAKDPARSAARLSNSTKQTLPQGPISFFAAGGFAGESVLDRLKPGERRFIPYGDDLDVELRTLQTQASEEPKRLDFVNDLLIEHFLRKSELTYELENRAGTERSIYLGLSLDKNAQVTGGDGLDYDGVQARPLVIFHQGGRQKAQRTLHATEGLSRSTAIVALSAAHLAELAAAGLPAPEKAVAGEAAARQREVEALVKEDARLKDEQDQLKASIARWREHLKAQGADARQGGDSPFVKRIVAEEDQLQALDKKREAAAAEIERRRGALRQTLGKLHRAA